MLTLPKSWCCFGKPPACTRRVRNRHEQIMPITFTGFTMAQNRCDFLASGGKLHCNIFLLYISPFLFRRGIYLLDTSCIRTFASGAAGNQTLWAHCLYCTWLESMLLELGLLLPALGRTASGPELQSSVAVAETNAAGFSRF